MANGWTAARKAQQAKMIRRWKPWTASTGPKSGPGKARSAMNRYRGGVRRLVRKLRSCLREQDRLRRDILGERAREKKRNGARND